MIVESKYINFKMPIKNRYVIRDSKLYIPRINCAVIITEPKSKYKITELHKRIIKKIKIKNDHARKYN